MSFGITGFFYADFMGFSTQAPQLVTWLEIPIEQIKLKGGTEGRAQYSRTGKPQTNRRARGKGEGRERKETESTSKGDKWHGSCSRVLRSPSCWHGG